MGSSQLASYNKYIQLNTTAAVASSTAKFNDTAPTASVFTVGTSNETNDSGQDQIAYCWHSVEGYSKIGTYAGSGGTGFIYCGFKPAYVLNKMIEPHNYGWVVEDIARDPYNVMGYQLYPDTNGAEAANHPRVDFVSNGFRWRDGSYDIDHASATYLFMAFAESPFKTSNGR